MRRMIFPLLIVGCVVFSLAPSLYELSRFRDLQPNRQFELVHNFPTDYNFYLSRIREGLEGRWIVVEKYTSEPHSGSFIHEMYLLMGRVGNWVRVPWGRSGDIYHVARAVLAVVLLALIAAFAKKSLGSKGIWGVVGFLFAVTASSWPKLVFVDGAWRFGGYMAWWSVVDSLQRITFIPHVLAGQALIVFLVMALSDTETLKKRGNVMFLGMLGFVLGMIFPPGLIFVYTVMGGMIAIHFYIEKRGVAARIAPYVGFVAVSMPAIAYLFLMTSMYPWKRLAQFDTIHPLPFDYVEYVKALGPMLPLGLVGLVVALWRREKLLLSSVAWVIAWIVLLGVFKLVPSQSPLRFTEMLPSVPLGFLSAYVFYKLYNRYENYNRYIWLILSFVLIALGLFHMYSSWLWQKDFVDHKIRAAFPLVPTGSYVMYPLKDFVSAMGFIQDHAPRDAVILSETTAGNYIPVYSGHTVYVGHDNTVAAEEKKQIVKRFFAGDMTPRQAQEFLTSAHIDFIFFGPQEREDLPAQAGGGIEDIQKPYPFLTRVYTNAFVTIYQVR